jgi:hypothetical protein
MTAAAMSKVEIIAYLDEYRSGEAFGATVFQGWAAVTPSPVLRGALRVIALREQFHADVLEQRVRELGGVPKHVYSEGEAFRKMVCSTADDSAKLAEFVRIASPDAIDGQLGAMVDRMREDPESQALMRAIIEDERATVTGLHGFSQTLSVRRSAA